MSIGAIDHQTTGRYITVDYTGKPAERRPADLLSSARASQSNTASSVHGKGGSSAQRSDPPMTIGERTTVRAAQPRSSRPAKRLIGTVKPACPDPRYPNDASVTAFTSRPAQADVQTPRPPKRSRGPTYASMSNGPLCSGAVTWPMLEAAPTVKNIVTRPGWSQTHLCGTGLPVSTYSWDSFTAPANEAPPHIAPLVSGATREPDPSLMPSLHTATQRPALDTQSNTPFTYSGYPGQFPSTALEQDVPSVDTSSTPAVPCEMDDELEALKAFVREHDDQVFN